MSRLSGFTTIFIFFCTLKINMLLCCLPFEIHIIKTFQSARPSCAPLHSAAKDTARQSLSLQLKSLKRSEEVKAEVREHYSALDDFVFLKVQSTRSIHCWWSWLHFYKLDSNAKKMLAWRVFMIKVRKVGYYFLRSLFICPGAQHSC
jgi:hypothetical protein